MEPKDGGIEKEATIGLSVVKANGETVGNFHLPPSMTVDDLAWEIEKAGGPPRCFQQLLCGHEELKDWSQELSALGNDVVQLLLSMPQPPEGIAVEWGEVTDTDKLLEELTIRDTNNERILMPAQRVAACAVEPDTGLVVLVGIGLEDLEEKGKGKGKVGKGTDGKGDDLPEDFKGKGKGAGGSKGKSGKDGKGGGSKGKSGKDDRGKASSKGKSREDYYNFVSPQLLVVSGCTADGPPRSFEVPLVVGHALTTAVELQVVESARGYPLPSLGMCVAMVRDEPYDSNCRKFLVAFELVPDLLVETVLPGCAECQAFCLDRPTHVIWVDHCAGRLRCNRAQLRGAAEAAEMFQLEGSARVTSIVKADEKILLTRASRHSVEVYDATGRWLMRLGDPTTRGCEDGVADKVRFWFPVWMEPLVEGPYGLTFKDSSPLISGPAGSIFVYSGGVLMKLAADLSAKKVMSVREELWMTDRDEGTPQYPEICQVIGIHDGYLYRLLVRTDYREEVILRRLKCEDSLLQPRSVLRQRAQQIWPDITDGKILVADHATWGRRPNVKPNYYHERSRDKWDGNCRWLREPWIWEECGPPPNAHELRMHRSGRLCWPTEGKGGSKSPLLWEEAEPIFTD